jgi:hypothetical protein
VHHSEAAFMTSDEQAVLAGLGSSGNLGPEAVSLGMSREPGMEPVTDMQTWKDLQALLTAIELGGTHKTTDNWTRDRGCALHGRDNCPTSSCVWHNKAPVPIGYDLVRAERNWNPALWHTYTMTRAAIQEEVQHESGRFEPATPMSNLSVTGTEALNPGVNEWRLFHGTSLGACQGICKTNFRLKLAGTGATWKTKGKDEGMPLYGYGVYLAESATKADEYAGRLSGEDEGLCCMLVVRATGGLARIVETNDFDPVALRRDIFDGPYHAVFGDRVKKLGKPFREIVIYDQAQLFPEFILYFKPIF